MIIVLLGSLVFVSLIIWTWYNGYKTGWKYSKEFYDESLDDISMKLRNKKVRP